MNDVERLRPRGARGDIVPRPRARSLPEAPDEGVFRSPESAGALLLLLGRNDTATLANLDAAIRCDRSIGLVAEETLRMLPCRPVPQTSGRLHVLEVEPVPDRRIACFTAGSTGQAKGVLRTVASWQRSFQMQRDVYPTAPDTQTVIIGSLTHSMHLYAAMEAMDRGIMPLVMPRFTPKGFADLCRQHASVSVFATPSHLNLMLSSATKHPALALPSVVRVLSGGAKLDERRLAALRRLFPAAEVVEFYGTTETSFITFKGANAPPGSVGTACPGVTMRIRDDLGRDLPPGGIGTLWVKSSMLFERYVVGSAPHTQWRDGFVSVGDQGYLDAAGNFFFTQRQGSMVTIAGQSVYTDDVERFLRQGIDQGECAVLAIRDALRGRRLIAATQFTLAPAESSRLLRAMRLRFGPLAAPIALVPLPDWPFLPSGKTDRREIAKRLAAGP